MLPIIVALVLLLACIGLLVTLKLLRQGNLRPSALITGLIGASVFTLFWWFITALGEVYLAPMTLTDWLFGVGPPILVFGSLVVAWHWLLLGGVLLALEGLSAVGYLVLWIIQGHFSLVWLICFLLVGLPLLASGILFILLWREERKQID